MSKRANIVIIGNVPPPVGGVTIHVRRLLDYMDRKKIMYDYIEISYKGVLSSLFRILTTRKKTVFHVQACNVYLKQLLAVACKLNHKAIFVNTLHGNLGVFDKRHNKIERRGLKWSNYPILLNKGSFDTVRKFNPNAKLLVAFIPPIVEETLPEEVIGQLIEFKRKYSYICATNAAAFVYDINGNETYGGLSLVNIFSKLAQDKIGLVFTDPTKAYLEEVRKIYGSVPDNIMFTGGVPFYQIIRNCDCLIRFTSKDGDSLSIREALFLGKVVVATDVVSRPEGVNLVKYGNESALVEIVKQIASNPNEHNNHEMTNGAVQLTELYKNILGS